MMKKQTRLLVGFLCLVTLFAGIWFAARPAVSAGEKTVSVEVVHQDGSVRTFTYHTDEEYLGDVLLSEGLVVGNAGPYGLYITEVDSESAIFEVDNAYWAFLHNGEYAMQGVDQTPVADGDTYSLVYTKG